MNSYSLMTSPSLPGHASLAISLTSPRIFPCFISFVCVLFFFLFSFVFHIIIYIFFLLYNIFQLFSVSTIRCLCWFIFRHRFHSFLYLPSSLSSSPPHWFLSSPSLSTFLLLSHYQLLSFSFLPIGSFISPSSLSVPFILLPLYPVLLFPLNPLP